MRRAAWSTGLACLAASGLWAYSSYYSDALTSIDTTYWAVNGSPTGTAAGLYVSGQGSVVSKVNVPDSSSDYDVVANLTLPASGGGYAILLRASQNASYGTTPTGTFYSVDLSSVTWNGGACTAYLQITLFDGSTAWGLNGKGVSCRDGMELRAWIKGTHIQVYQDGAYALSTDNSTLATGKPGVGGWTMGAGNGITNVQLRPIDRTAPPLLTRADIASTEFPNRVELKWVPVTDNPGGIGNVIYSIFRDGSWMMVTNGSSWSDETVQPGATYTYGIYTCDEHQNWGSPLNFTVVTPPAGAIDPRRTGVRPDGAYWGGGDQIDVRSGNMNVSFPLFRAMGRGGWGVTFALSYNSQLWRQDGGGDWKLGRNIGYGFGWQLQAGAVLPVYQANLTVHHYKYIDSTGSEYRLELNVSVRPTQAPAELA